jgi:hypothetical protein
MKKANLGNQSALISLAVVVNFENEKLGDWEIWLKLN